MGFADYLTRADVKMIVVVWRRGVIAATSNQPAAETKLTPMF